MPLVLSNLSMQRVAKCAGFTFRADHLPPAVQPIAPLLPGPCQPGEAARKWKECDARALTYSVESLLTSMIPVHEALIKDGGCCWVWAGQRWWVLSGAGKK